MDTARPNRAAVFRVSFGDMRNKEESAVREFVLFCPDHGWFIWLGWSRDRAQALEMTEGLAKQVVAVLRKAERILKVPETRTFRIESVGGPKCLCA